ncbi:MAG: hypothetical protein EPN21_12300 [Methylococcaceae bacterium]|nr:MAG: hypothetical protein EPN21_12300 [Methylococcaceae bacterium]
MNTNGIEALISKLLGDASLRDGLFANPKAALEGVGYEATPDLIDAIVNLNRDDLLTLAQGFEAGRASDRVAA